MKGKFVTLEGCEGVGKSTQLRLLQEYLERRGIDAVFTREPGGTAISEQIRAVILDKNNSEMDAVTELLLYEAARRQHTTQFIARRLEEGKLVVCDRYADSSVAYQGYARGIGADVVKKLNALATAGVKTDVTLFLDLAPEQAFCRKGGRDEQDRLENEKIEFHKKVYAGFLSIAQEERERFVRIDASGDKMQTHARIIRVLADKGVVPPED